MKRSGNKRTATTPIGHVQRDRPRTSPHPFPGWLESTGDQLAQLVGGRLLGSFGRGPLDGLVSVVGRASNDAQVWFSRPCLFERQPEQLRAFLLCEEGARDAGLVLGTADAVRAVGFGVDCRVRAVAKRLVAESGESAPLICGERIRA